MSSSYPFPTYSGLLEPHHYKQIGSAVWLFLWCISSTTAEKEKEGIVWGIVLGNKPIKLEEIAGQFGVDKRTVSRWIKDLEEYEYIRVTRAPYGLIFTVKNSKKFIHRDKTKLSVLHNAEWSELSDLTEREQTYMSNHEDKNVHSNKDITEINNAVVVSRDEIIRLSIEVEKHFCMRRGQGFNVSPTDLEKIQQMMATGIPLEIVKQSIDKAFAEYQPKHAFDKINSMAFCIPRCLDEWARIQVNDSITVTVPDVPVALGAIPSKKSRKQAEIDELDQFIREEEERNHGNRRSS